MLRRRLDAAGLGSLATEAARAMVVGDVPWPPAAEEILPDLAALPVSPRAYQAVIDRALIVSQVEGQLQREGVELEDARRLARDAADETMRRRRGRVAAPTWLRVAVDVVPDADHAAEEEHAAGEEQVPPRVRVRGS